MGVVGKVFDTVSTPLKNAVAANRALDINNERIDLKNAQKGIVDSGVKRILKKTANIVHDVVNVGTLGTADKLVNKFRDKDQRIDYSHLSDEVKSGHINDNSLKQSIQQRTVALVNESVKQAQLDNKFSSDALLEECKQERKNGKQAEVSDNQEQSKFTNDLFDIGENASDDLEAE